MQKQESEYNMIDWCKKVMLNNYSNFSGRARRAEFWYFHLTYFIILVPLYALIILGIANDIGTLSTLGIFISGLVVMGTFLPGLALTVRRLHDINKSGWYYFICLIPLIGSIILLVWFFTEGDRFTNNYGADPKSINEVAFDFERPEIAS